MISTQSTKTPIADLHTPAELLANSKKLLDSRDPQLMRAAILEANAALEAYVQSTVFPILENRTDPRLVKYLEETTRMNFDARISILTPIATGHPVDTNSRLWQDYKKAREIRKKVVHGGAKVTVDSAKQVYDIIYEWIAYLGSTVDLELAFIELKKYVEESGILIEDERMAQSVVAKYFQKTTPASDPIELFSEVLIGNGQRAIHSDVFLKFGSEMVLIETKLVEKLPIHSIIETAIEQVSDYLRIPSLSRIGLILFQRNEIPPRFETVQKYFDGKLYLAVIRIVPQVEADLLNNIKRQKLSEDEEKRLLELNAKRWAETLTSDEHAGLLKLSDRAEELQAQRIKYLAELARLRKTSLTELMQSLGIQPRAL